MLTRAAAELHQDRLLARADRAAGAAERAVQRVWAQLLALVKAGGPRHLVEAAARRVLRGLPAVAGTVLDELAATARDAAGWTAQRLAAGLPRAHRAHLLRTRTPLLDSPRPSSNPLLEADELDPLAELLLPNLLPDQVTAVVYAAGWLDRVQALTRLAEPDVLAARLATGVQAGLSVQQIARDIRPALQGVQTSARRVARTAGLWVAHEAELAVYDGLGDVVAGYTVRAVLDRATRPAHRRRDGHKFYREPRAGQQGFDRMPRPPREADGSWAFNCRCWLDPILADV